MDHEDLKEKSPELVVSDVSDETLVKSRPPSLETIVDEKRQNAAAQEAPNPNPRAPTHPSLAGSAGNRSDDLLGKTIGGHYEVLDKIGAGGMSTVYKAKHVLLDRFVAIKFILPKLIYDEQAAMRFQQEARASTQLNHDNICNVREFEIYEGNRAFLVMDFLDGKPLVDIIRQEQVLDRERALSIAAQMCAGLAHAHSKGVIHRDIKPGNVVINTDAEGNESVKIVDFGLAKMLREDQAGPNLTQTGEVFGTPLYMSPEQCLGRRVDARSDIYSLGCVMHEMIHGTPPFRAESTVEVMLNHVNELPALEGSNDVDAVILKCLQKNADRRYATAEELLEDIEALRRNRAPKFAKPRNPKLHKQIGIGLIVIFLTIAATIGGITYKSMTEHRALEQQWNIENDRAREMFAQKNFDEAEKSLERALVLAKESKNRELITLTLGSLSSIEQTMGKTDEANEHSRAAAERPSGARLQQFFLGAAAAMIILGLIIFVAMVLLFGGARRNKEFWTMSLNDRFSKK